MRLPPFFAAWCVLVLLVFALAKQFGYDAWPFAAGAYATASSGAGSSGSGSSSGGYSSGSATHK